MHRDSSLQPMPWAAGCNPAPFLIPPIYSESTMNKLSRYSLVSVPAMLAMGAARAEDPASALAAVTTLSTSATGFGPVMWGLAVAVVGILVGVKWIKRAKGAA